MNQIVLEHLNPEAWQASLAGSRGRTIAAIFSHMHNARRKWLRLSSPHLKLPAALNRSRSTQEQAKSALAESAERCCEMIAEAPAFLRDGWAKPWPAGPAALVKMVAYMVAHDAHHRGQACMLAHQLGYRLPAKCTAGMWSWERFSRLR